MAVIWIATVLGTKTVGVYYTSIEVILMDNVYTIIPISTSKFTLFVCTGCGLLHRLLVPQHQHYLGMVYCLCCGELEDDVCECMFCKYRIRKHDN